MFSGSSESGRSSGAAVSYGWLIPRESCARGLVALGASASSDCHWLGRRHWWRLPAASPRPPCLLLTASWLPLGRERPLPWYRARSEEHTSELQSLMRISYAVFCLKKKKKQTVYKIHRQN